MTVTYDLPMPTSANRLFLPRPDGTWTKTPAYKAWREAAGWTIHEQKRVRVLGEYILTIELCRPDKRRRDLDNTIKGLSDLLVEVGVVEDDSLMAELHMRWVAAGPACRVVITPRTDPAVPPTAPTDQP